MKWMLFILLFVLVLIIAIYPLRRYKALVAITFLSLLTYSSYTYYHFGSYLAWQEYEQQEQIKIKAQALLKQIGGVDEVIDRLKKRIAAEPKSVRGWYLLGRLYASRGEWEAARDAFAKAHEYDKKDVKITINYANSLWYVNNRRFNEKIHNLFNDVLKANPEQIDALGMMAMDSYQAKKYQQAIDYWQALLKQIPANSEEGQAIRRAITKAMAKLAQ